MKDFDDAMLDIAWKNLEIEEKRYKDIDTKAIGLITISGILMTFLAKSTEGFNILFFLTALSFMATVLFSALVIRVRYSRSLSTKLLIQDFRNEAPERQIRGIIGTIAAAEDALSDICDRKANELRYSVFALCFSITFLIIYSLSPFFFR